MTSELYLISFDADQRIAALKLAGLVLAGRGSSEKAQELAGVVRKHAQEARSAPQPLPPQLARPYGYTPSVRKRKNGKRSA